MSRPYFFSFPSLLSVRHGVTAAEPAAVSMHSYASCPTVTTILMCHMCFLGIPLILE